MNAIVKEPLLRLRPMTEGDIAQVMAVETAAYRHPWTQGIFLDCLQVGYCCWLLEVEAQVVGHGVLSVAVGEAHLLNLCVHPMWQGRGFGRRILAQMLDLARQHRADTVFLEVRAANQVAKLLYQSEGFNEIGRRNGYYPAPKGQREDAVVFAKQLI